MQNLTGSGKKESFAKLSDSNMHIRIAAVGKVKNQASKEMIQEYVKRISAHAKLDIVEIKDSTKEQEGKDLLKKTENTKRFVLSSEGRQLSSEKFAGLIKNQQSISFIIGGPTGLSDEIKESGVLISFSLMTFPHELCRVMLTEQIYRAFMILTNHPYHK